MEIRTETHRGYFSEPRDGRCGAAVSTIVIIKGLRAPWLVDMGEIYGDPCTFLWNSCLFFLEVDQLAKCVAQLRVDLVPCMARALPCCRREGDAGGCLELPKLVG